MDIPQFLAHCGDWAYDRHAEPAELVHPAAVPAAAGLVRLRDGR